MDRPPVFPGEVARADRRLGGLDPPGGVAARDEFLVRPLQARKRRERLDVHARAALPQGEPGVPSALRVGQRGDPFGERPDPPGAIIAAAWASVMRTAFGQSPASRYRSNALSHAPSASSSAAARRGGRQSPAHLGAEPAEQELAEERVVLVDGFAEVAGGSRRDAGGSRRRADARSAGGRSAR